MDEIVTVVLVVLASGALFIATCCVVAFLTDYPLAWQFSRRRRHLDRIFRKYAERRMADTRYKVGKVRVENGDLVAERRLEICGDTILSDRAVLARSVYIDPSPETYGMILDELLSSTGTESVEELEMYLDSRGGEA